MLSDPSSDAPRQLGAGSAPAVQGALAWAARSIRGVELPGAYLSDLAASADGRRIFLRRRPLVDQSFAAVPGTSLGPAGAGTQIALDAESFVEQGRLSLDELLLRDRREPGQVCFTRHSPRGDTVWVVVGSSAAMYMFDAERLGERVDVAHCTSALHFSDASFVTEDGDSVLVSKGEGVETRHAHTEWLGVHATNAAADAGRIAAVGPRELAVYDRQAGRERFRAKVGESWQVALLPEGRTAVVSGPYGKKQLRVFDWNGTEVSVFRMRYANATVASPSGCLAMLSGSTIQIVDLRAPRGVRVDVAEFAELAWLDDARMAVIRADRRAVAVLDVSEALAAGRLFDLEAPRSKKASPPKEAPKPEPGEGGSFKARAAVAIRSLRARGVKPVLATAAGKFAPESRYRAVPDAVRAALFDCIQVEVAWSDEGAPVFGKRLRLGPHAIRNAAPGQHFFIIAGENFAAGMAHDEERTMGLPSYGGTPAEQLDVDGAHLQARTFWERYRPFVFFADTWFAAALDGGRLLRGTRDMRRWESDTRAVATVIEQGLRWLEGAEGDASYDNGTR